MAGEQVKGVCRPRLLIAREIDAASLRPLFGPVAAFVLVPRSLSFGIGRPDVADRGVVGRQLYGNWQESRGQECQERSSRSEPETADRKRDQESCRRQFQTKGQP